jgi:hypothetical protein
MDAAGDRMKYITMMLTWFRCPAGVLLSLTVLVACLVPGGMAGADTVERVLMPGALIEGHADLEGDCKNCHARFDRAAQTGLCLDCHKEIARDIRQQRRFHSRVKEKEKECRVCHTDHKGRKMNIAPIDKKTFDHGLTEFPLKGGHAASKVECVDCHKPKTKYRETPSTCYACHKKDDKHKGKLGRECANCHVERNWKDVHFDHSKTKFPLTGKHVDVACKACHKDPTYKQTPMECYACHKKDDKHKARFGSKCETCHVDKGWKQIIFDHDEDTKYPLRGKHAQAKCESCHKGILYKEKLSSVCYACHKKDDKHKGQEGQKCETCHDERSWKTTRFDHDLTRFPLLGKHDDLDCDKCHKSPTFKDASIECVSCHLKDDEHKRRLGPNCGLCHDARNWKYWNFDHNTRTKFVLDGKHDGLECQACHTTPVVKKFDLSSTCNSCHERDDVHNGGFGPLCEQCHVTSSFKTVRLPSQPLPK